jgi:phosphate-selective porin OprO and OprP
MNTVAKMTAIAAALLAMSGTAYGQKVETKGGVGITSDDGKYSVKVGGRIHLDTNFYVDDDDLEPVSLPTDLFFRRARLTLEGKAEQFTYKFENDFVASNQAGFREMWVGTKVGGANLRLGQAKPYRAMEELTSSNEVLFMERPFASTSGMYDGRQFQIGAFLDGAGSNWGWGTSVHSLRSADQPANDGIGFTVRGYFAPIVSDTSNLHLGLSYSLENPDENVRLRARARAAGRATNVPRPTFGDTGNNAADPAILLSGTEASVIGLEAAYQAGGFFVQAEYAMGTYEGDGVAERDVDTYYVQASYLLSGASKRYDVKKGVFKSPSVKAGTAELKARYDYIENDATTAAELTQLALGVNYYFNNNVRAMVEYVSADLEPADQKIGLVQTRLQFAF